MRSVAVAVVAVAVVAVVVADVGMSGGADGVVTVVEADGKARMMMQRR